MSESKGVNGLSSMNTGLGLVFGAGVGLVFGTVFGNTAIGLVFGAGIGLVIGAGLDLRKRKRGGGCPPR